MQKKQATGIDTRMMIPVYGGIFAIICQWGLPWISIPALRYSKLPTAYRVFGFGKCIENVQASLLSGGKLHMEPFTPVQLRFMEHLGKGIALAAAGLILLHLICIVLVVIRKDRSVTAVRITFSCHFLYTAVLAVLAIAGNIFLNHAMDRPNSFLNLSLYSYLQLTSWVYGQMIVSAGIAAAAGKLMDVTRETGPQTYVERTQREDRTVGRRTKVSLVLITVAIPLVIFFGIFFLNDRSNVFIGLCIILLAMIPFAMVFEDRRPQARELLLIAVLSAIAVVGRMAFFMVPQFKPVTAIVIVAGIGLGAEAGFLTGAVSGFVSNFFVGQGPWTPWQMFAFGIIGFLAGLVFGRSSTEKIHSKKGEKLYMVVLCTFGALSTFFLYGFIMDFSAALTFTKDFSWEILVGKLISGIPFNAVHAASTVVFLLLLARPIQRKLDRIKKKYGILEV